MFTHILIAFDGSELSKQALQSGLTLAKTTGAKVTLYRAIIEYLPMSEFAVEPPSSIVEELSHAVDHSLEVAAQYAQSQGITLSTRRSVELAPYLGIIECAKTEGCDLILMASHGRRGLSALILGSETQKVLTHSTIPVLVYR
jgi:Universal stress protein UspA and related nucleotide-binding proteins